MRYTFKKCSRCELDNKEVVLIFDKHRWWVTLKYDPKILVPVWIIKLGIKNFQLFNIAFNNIIQDKTVLLGDLLIDKIDFNKNVNRVALRVINYETYVLKYVNAAELITKILI